MRIAHRSGFSLIEALVVLAIGGMALAVIFSIGLKTGNTGFALGRRAMAAADVDVVRGDIRTMMQSFELKPSLAMSVDSDRPFEGSPTEMRGQIILPRATACGRRGWAGVARLSIEPTETGQALVCHLEGEPQTLLEWEGRDGGSFAYSRDGETWVDNLNEPVEQNTEDPTIAESLQVWIRLKTGDDLVIVTSIATGRPLSWLRFDLET